jgi:hypothetical protein
VNFTLFSSFLILIKATSVQRVYAIGKPPPDEVCFFRNLKNVVVFSTVGALHF